MYCRSIFCFRTTYDHLKTLVVVNTIRLCLICIIQIRNLWVPTNVWVSSKCVLERNIDTFYGQA